MDVCPRTKPFVVLTLPLPPSSHAYPHPAPLELGDLGAYWNGEVQAQFPAPPPLLLILPPPDSESDDDDDDSNGHGPPPAPLDGDSSEIL